jgi:hypothetical protein
MVSFAQDLAPGVYEHVDTGVHTLWGLLILMRLLLDRRILILISFRMLWYGAEDRWRPMQLYTIRGTGRRLGAAGSALTPYPRSCEARATKRVAWRRWYTRGCLCLWTLAPLPL